MSIPRDRRAATEAGRDEDRLREMISSSSWMMRALATVREADLPDAWIGAGTIRDFVWGRLHGSGFSPGDVRDVDVAFFDPVDLRPEADQEATRRLHVAWPQVPWEASNQAATKCGLSTPRRISRSTMSLSIWLGSGVNQAKSVSAGVRPASSSPALFTARA